jgi:putative SOS response-associated peptidase YedK
MFRQAMDRRRCLIPADGFYEWKGAKPPKQPFFIHRRDDDVFCFAGLWERWKPGPDVEPVDTFTILTTSPNSLMADIHNRMPVILEEKDYPLWLDRSVPGKGVQDLLKPYPPELLEAYPVSTFVNSPKNEGPECSEPVK